MHWLFLEINPWSSREPILGCGNFMKAFFLEFKISFFSLGCKIDYLYIKVFQININTVNFWFYEEEKN